MTGASAFDTATLTVSGPIPTGTVTYTLFSTSTSCTGPSTTQVVTLNGDGTVPNSSTTSTLGAGSYSYEASYSGDSNYDVSGQSTCEPFSVLQATPSISTKVFDVPTNTHWSGTETTGATAYDTASIEGTVAGFVPTGTVTYTLFSTSTSCTGPSTTQVVTLNGDGTVPNSSTTSTLGAGSYSYEASYSGDSNYDVSGQSTCEPFSVLQATPSISTKVFARRPPTPTGPGRKRPGRPPTTRRASRAPSLASFRRGRSPTRSSAPAPRAPVPRPPRWSRSTGTGPSRTRRPRPR